MKLLVIFTGGTIGSTINEENYIGTDDHKKYMLLDRYYEACPDKSISFDTITPYTILSENLCGSNINILSQCVSENQYEYDGIIITHGTDTLAYTAAGLSLLHPGIELPVVLVSSNYVLEDCRSNGVVNFISAVEFIKQRIGGIYVAYNNGDTKTYIHHGSMVLPHAPYTDRLFSLDDKCAGYIEDGKYNPVYTLKPKELPESILSSHNNVSGFSDCSDVYYINEHPGNNYQLPAADTKAVLIATYHSGTICTAGSRTDAFLCHCKENKIPVYLVGIEDRVQYESTKYYKAYDINIMPKISPVLAYMLLWLITG